MKVQVLQSKKKNNEGRYGVLLLVRRRVNGKVIDMRSKTNIFLSSDRFDEKEKSIKEYQKNVLPSPEVKYNKKEMQRLKDLVAHIDTAFSSLPNADQAQGKWLSDAVDRFLFPDKYEPKKETRDIYQLYANYLKSSDFSDNFKSIGFVVARAIYRWEQYRRATDSKDFCIDIDTLDSEDIEDLRDFLGNECRLKEENEGLFAGIINSYPDCIKSKRTVIGERGGNCVKGMLERFAIFFSYLRKTGVTANNPFQNFERGSEQYGEPFFLSLQERDLLYHTAMPNGDLERQRDIFVFQCCVGCRVSDLITLTKDNITKDGVLVYSPEKTHKKGRVQKLARVPLNRTARELIEKYDGLDRRGRLFPCSSNIRYNVCIKLVLSIAGINRLVPVRDSLSEKTVMRPINEVASSHMARRTFIGNVYKEVTDPNLISIMSGHVQGSRSFERYRSITDDITKNVIEKVEAKL